MTRPLLPAVPDPVSRSRALSCTSQGDVLKPWLWWESRRAQGLSCRAWPCDGSSKSRILPLGSVPHHPPGSSPQSEFVGSNVCILVVLSD